MWIYSALADLVEKTSPCSDEVFLVDQLGRPVILLFGAKPFGFGAFALRLALPSRRGAICARLADASIDSLALDYVAFGSNRSRHSASLTAQKQKRDNREGYLSFVGGPTRTRT